MMAVAGLLVTMGGAAAAQGGGMGGMGGGGGMQRMQEMLFKGIELTADQKTRIEAIQKQQATDMQGIDRTAPEGREKMAAVRAKATDAMKAILTPDQQKVFDTNREEMQKMMQNRPPRPPAL
jgi:Spy/CpxP family protein refolding chaperone